MSIERPDPDELLKSIKEKEDKHKKGKLKIYFGMIAGSGKTYKMLKDSHEYLKESEDLYIGYIETHGRIDTEKLLDGLRIIPRKKIKYRDVVLEEMDLDEILKLKPAVVIVDELAHTNVPDSRHKKRFQDVLEILENGIDVWSTLNIQHLDSRSITVEQITGIKILETIPDSVFDIADEIELVDVPQDVLLERLDDGKIYPKDRIENAKKNFFKRQNITALREMALRLTAKYVNKELSQYILSENIQSSWKTGERLLVAIGASPYSDYLIKWTRRIASNLQAKWYAVNVENSTVLSYEEQKYLNKNIELVKSLGGNYINTFDDDVAEGIKRIAKLHNITQIIIGKPLKKNFSGFILKKNITNRLIKISGDIDIYVVSEPGINKSKHIPKSKIKSNKFFKEITISALYMAATTLLNYMIVDIIGYWSVSIIYIFSLSILSLYVSLIPSLFSATVCSLLWNFLFIPPKFTFYIYKIDDVFMFFLFFTVSIIISNLTSRLNKKKQILINREKNLEEVYEITSLLNNAENIREILDKSHDFLKKIFALDLSFVLIDENKNISGKVYKKNDFEISDKDMTILKWVIENKKPAGKSTDTLSQSENYFIPLISGTSIVGILVIKHGEKSLSFEQNNQLNTITQQIAMAIERDALIENKHNLDLLLESDKIFNIILNSISHELRTPLTSLSISVSGLFDESMMNDKGIKTILCNDIIDATERLNRVIGNLLSIITIEAGKLKLHLEWTDISEVIDIVLKKTGRDLKNFHIVKNIEENLPYIFIDIILMDQVITNILYNAVIHSPEGSEILLKIFLNNDKINIIIKDEGSGIPEADLHKIFDKFYKSSSKKSKGLGLGLSICKSIVEIHKGRIYAENNEKKGTSFIIELPVNLK